MPNVSPAEIGILHELEPVVEANLNRHEATAKLWQPHDFVPWDEGRNFAAMGGEDWDPSQSRLSEDAQMALILNLLTEDNLPSYHRIIAEQFGLDGPWGQWVGRWTAEENRHAIVIRDFLVVTRAVDPVDLEKMRMEHMTRGYRTQREKTPLETLAYVTFQELATRMSHRNTGKICNDPTADAMLTRVAADENLHMLFYRNLVEAALEVAPDEMMEAIATEIADFQMPGSDLPGFGIRAAKIALAGIYTPTQHLEEVVAPVLRQWRIFSRNDFGPKGEVARENLVATLQRLQKTSDRFELRQARRQGTN